MGLTMKHILSKHGNKIIACETSGLNLVDFTVEILTYFDEQTHTDVFIAIGLKDYEHAHEYKKDIEHLKNLYKVYAEGSKLSADDLIKQEFEKVAKEWDLTYDIGY